MRNVIPGVCTFFCFLGLLSCSTSNSEKTVYAGNPVLEGWYADPEVIVYDDRYWIYPTYSDDFDRQVFMDAFSSPDLVNWTKHERIIDTAAVTWAKRAMWAPGVISKDDQYYLFFAANDVHEGEVGGIGVGVADKPEGPFRDLLGKPLINEIVNEAQPIDQYIFQDTDGTYCMCYGGWGRCNMVRLNDDFTGLLPFEDGELYKEEVTPEGYMEGPFMFIRNGKYYFIWSEGGVLYYNSPALIQRKTELAKEQGLGGVMIWHILADSQGDQSLLQAVKKGME